MAEADKLEKSIVAFGSGSDGMGMSEYKPAPKMIRALQQAD